MLASETAALDIVGAHFVRDVAAGRDGRHRRSRAAPRAPLRRARAEAVPVRVRLLRPARHAASTATACTRARQRMGEELARQAPVDADMVMPVPESGIPAAQGFARESGIPYGDGLVKNRYVGRTFIQPSQQMRGVGVRLKLNPLPENIRGKRLVVVDDSIVRGTTTRQVVAMLREAGAARGALPRLVAAVPLAVLLRHGHRPPLRAARGRPLGRRDPRLPRRRLARVPRARPASAAPPARRPSRSAPRASPATTRCRSPDERGLEARCSRTPVLDLTESSATRDPRDRRRRDRRLTRGPPGDGPLTYARGRASTSRPGEKAVELHQGARALDVPPRGDRRRRRLRRALRARPAAAPRPAARRRRPTASARSRSIARLDRSLRHDRPRRRGDVASTTSRSRAPSRSSSSTTSRSGKLVPETIDEIVDRRRRRVPPGRLRAARRRDVRAPRPHGPGRVRPRRLRGRRRRARRCCPRGVRAGRPDHRDRAVPGCAATATRSRAGRCSSGAAARSTSRRGAGAHHSLGDELLRPERDLRARDARSCGGTSRCTRSRTSPAAGSPATSLRVLPDDCDAVVRRGIVGRAAHLRRDPGRRRRAPTTRWSRSSTSGSACSRSCRAATCSTRSTWCAPPATRRGSSARSSTATAAAPRPRRVAERAGPRSCSRRTSGAATQVAVHARRARDPARVRAATADPDRERADGARANSA